MSGWLWSTEHRFDLYSNIIYIWLILFVQRTEKISKKETFLVFAESSEELFCLTADNVSSLYLKSPVKFEKKVREDNLKIALKIYLVADEDEKIRAGSP